MKRTAEQTTSVVKKVRASVSLSPTFLAQHPPGFNDGLQMILTKHPDLYPLISEKQFEAFPLRQPASQTNHYEYLTRSIISQQIHIKAADAILGRLQEHFGHFPTPEDIKEAKEADLRSMGLSLRKASYVKSVSDHFLNKGLEEYITSGRSNEELIERLVEIKGIGVWSAQMFLVFALQRLDVFASGDLGIKRGFSFFVSDRKELLDGIPKPIEKVKQKRTWSTYSEEAMNSLAAQYEPFRSVFMLVLWRIAAGDTGGAGGGIA